MTRREALAAALGGAVMAAQTGPAVPGLSSFDDLMAGLLDKYGIPGGALAVVRNGKPVFTRGYGLADRRQRTAVEPDSLFRIASLSKAVTAVTVLKLVDESRLSLDGRAFEILRHLEPPPGATVDSRLRVITIRQLLQHSGGWDRDKSFDPMFRSAIAAEAVGARPPASAETIIRYMLGQPLDFNPGERYAYSNFGYAVLGRIVEHATGTPYERYVRVNVLAPLGIERMRVGHTLLRDRLPGEVAYHAAGMAPSVFPDGPLRVPRPYGAWYLEAMDAHGGWVASAPDYARFVASIGSVLSRKSVGQLTARPDNATYLRTSSWYGMGFQIRPANGDANWWHTGSLDGTATYVLRTYHGLVCAAFFNSRSDQSKSLFGEIDRGMWKAIRAAAWS